MEIILKFKQEILKLISFESPVKLAVAVSGGSDSLALCFLLHQLLSEINFDLVTITIDHKLRLESSEEAIKTKQILNEYGVDHVTVSWEGEKPSSNLQENARLARYALLADYCHRNDVTYLVTGHQMNDQAENFIIRADHGAGLYGLAGIPSIAMMNNIKIIRPLLNFTKEELQSFLKNKNISWIEDPSNGNPKFVRVRARNFLNKHSKWIVKLANISANLAKTKECIEYFVHKAMDDIVINNDSSDEINLDKFNELPQEIRFRLIAYIVQKRGKQEKPPRAERIENLLNKLKKGKEFSAATLSHCLIKRKKNIIVITTEFIIS